MHFAAVQNITPNGNNVLYQRSIVPSLPGFAGVLEHLIA